MKIAIPTRNSFVDDHFGHCEYYTIYSISEKNQVESKEAFQAPRGCGCKSNIAAILRNKGVSIMLAGNMGQGAVQKLTSAGIDVYRGCSGKTDEVMEAFLRSEISDSGQNCGHHHEHGKQCGHD